MCKEVKINLFEKILCVTNTNTIPNEDPYEQPSSLKILTINRLKSRKTIEKGTTEHKYRKSIFSLCNPKYLRRDFVAKLDDGQERTFKIIVKFYEEGGQDRDGRYKEAFNDVISHLFVLDKNVSNRMLPLFIASNNMKGEDKIIPDKFISNPACNQAAKLFGQIFGISHIMINFNLCLIFWGRMVSLSCNITHIEETNAAFTRKYKYIKIVTVIVKTIILMKHLLKTINDLYTESSFKHAIVVFQGNAQLMRQQRN